MDEETQHHLRGFRMKMPKYDLRKVPKLGLNISLDLDIIIKLDKLARKWEKSHSKVINRILKEYKK